MRFGTWNVRFLYRAGSITAAARNLQIQIRFLGVQEVTWNKRRQVTAWGYNFFYGKGNENQQIGTIISK